MIRCAIMIPDQRPSPHRISKEKSHKYKCNIHHHSISCNPILSRDSNQLPIVQHSNYGGRQVRHHLRSTIGAYLSKCT